MQKSGNRTSARLCVTDRSGAPARSTDPPEHEAHAHAQDMDLLSPEIVEAYQMAELFATCAHFRGMVAGWLRSWLCRTAERLERGNTAGLRSSFLNVAAADNLEALKWLVLVGGLTPRGSTLASARGNDGSRAWLLARNCPRWPSLGKRVRTKTHPEGYLKGVDQTEGVVKIPRGHYIAPLDDLLSA